MAQDRETVRPKKHVRQKFSICSTDEQHIRKGQSKGCASLRRHLEDVHQRHKQVQKQIRGTVRDEEKMRAVKKLMPESLWNYRFRGTTMSYDEHLVAESELRVASESLHKGQKGLDRRNEVVNEALAEEVRRAEQRKTRADDAAATVPEPEQHRQHEIQEIAQLNLIQAQCDGLPYFRNFCHMSCFAVRDVRDCHSPLSCLKHVSHFALMLVGSRPSSQFALMRCHLFA